MATGATAAFSHRCILYTAHNRCTGTIRSQHRLFPDVLNRDLDAELVLWDGLVMPLGKSTPDQEDRVDYAQIKREAIVMVLPELGAGRHTSGMPTATTREVSVLAWPFAIHGRCPNRPADGGGAPRLAGDFPEQFVPLFDCTVVYTPSPLLTFPSPLILVNQAAIEIVSGLVSSFEFRVSGSDSVLPDGPSERSALPVVSESIGSPLGGSAVGAPDPARNSKLETLGDPVVLAALAGHTSEQIAGIDVTDLYEVLERAGVLRDIPPEGLKRSFQELRCAGTVDWRMFEDGEVVFRKGEPGETVYFLAMGTLEVILPDGPGGPIQVGTLKAGDIFGEMAVMGDHTRQATIKAGRQSYALGLTEHGFRHLLRRHPELTTRLLQIISERLTQNEAKQGR